jgi:MFS transporter, YQGE family, putative transporter
MYSIFKSFSSELKFYLMMNALFSFGGNLSGVFQSVFLWKLDKTYSLLAYFSMYWSLAIILFFGLCAWLARKTNPLITMRLGFVFYLITYLIMLIFHQTLSEHIFLLGAVNGLAMSLYFVGMHMAVLDLTTNDKRDQFLYVQGILFTVGGMVAPLLSGIIISQLAGMVGYYIIFIATCVFFILAFFVSLKVKVKPVASKSFFWEVVKHPSAEWRKMYKVMFADGIVSGVYTTFLITMMTFKVAGGEFSLGVFNTAAEIISLLAFYALAKYSSPDYRIRIFAIGAVGILLGSVFISAFPMIVTLVLFAIIQPVSMNMISTSMNAMIYASIEKDPQYKEKRLDYIIIREIPLGIGRIIGVAMFLTMRQYFDIEKLFPISFSFFPLVYIVMIPSLYSIWKKPKHGYQSKTI